LAVASLKKFIVEDKYRIELRDLVSSETEVSFKSLFSLAVQPNSPINVEYLFDRMRLYEGTCEILLHLLAHGSYWGGSDQLRFWQDAISRMSKLKQLLSGNNALLSLQIYPACLSLYSAGVGAIAGGKYETLSKLLREISIDDNGVERPLLRVALPWSVLSHSIAKQLPGYAGRGAPISDRIFDILREPLKEYLPDEADYANVFDRFEYFAALVHLDLRILSGDTEHAPIGRFQFRVLSGNQSEMNRVLAEAKKYGDNWDVIRSGVFPSVSRFIELETSYRQKILPLAYQL
jgi:hypothetical protein